VWAAKSPREWHMAAHTLKGSALGIGAATLAQRARDAEALQTPLHVGRCAIIAAVTAAITDVTCEIERLGLA
jgi:HPt (histidine-containing phosphotransfer) domain-containing protein